MKTRKRQWTHADKWLIALALLGVATLGVWGWIENQPTPQRLLELGIGTTAYRGMLLSSNQQFLAANTDVYDGIGVHTDSIRLWNTRTLKPELPFTSPRRISSICISGDATKIGLIYDTRTTFERRDRATQKLLWSFPAPKPYIRLERALFLKENSQILLVAAKFGGATRHFLLATRSGAIQGEWDSEDSLSRYMSLSPDQKMVAYSQTIYVGFVGVKGAFIVIQRSSDGHILRRYKKVWNCSAPLFSPDGRFLILVTAPEHEDPKIFNNVVRCIDTHTGQEIWSYDALHAAKDINPWRRYQISKNTGGSESDPYDFVAFSGFAISHDGKTIAAIRCIDSTIYLLNANTGKLQRTLALPTGKAELSSLYTNPNLLFAPDGKHLFALTNDSLYAWDLTTG